ncbi:MAG: DUF3857 domain-containing transglutaminase family protein [Candidatus Polarisedimenticolia bacterium]
MARSLHLFIDMPVLLGLVLAAAPAASIVRAAPAPAIETGEDAVVLEERLEIEILSVREARLRYSNSTKVLTPKGVEAHVTAEVDYGLYEKVTEISGAVISPQGKRTEVKKQRIADEAAYGGFELYSDSRQRVLYFPGVVPGATVEYAYEIEVRSLFYLPSRFALQDFEPARLRRLVVRAPAGFPLRHSTRGSPEFRHEERDGVATYTWEVRDVAGLKREADMPPPADVYPLVFLFPKEFTYDDYRIDAATWDGLARWYWELARERMTPTPEVAAKARELTAGLTDPMEMTHRLFEHAQKKINYVAVEYGLGGLQPHHSAEVLRHAYGDCKDKTTLLIAMLKAVGLQGYPVLIRTRDAGAVDRDFPEDRFNHVITAVPGENGYLFMDPTDDRTAFGDLPWVDQGANALLVKDGGAGELVETPLLPADRNRTQRLVRAAISPTGDLSGTYVVEVFGQEKASYTGFLDSKPTEREDELSLLLSWLCPGAIMEGHEVALPGRPEEPLRVVIRFRVPRFVSRAGSAEIVTPYLARFGWLGRITAYTGRRYPVFFEYLFSDRAEIHLSLPPGRRLRRTPADHDHKGPGLSASTKHEVTTEGGRQILVVRRSVSVDRREIPVAEYQALRDFLSAVQQEEARAVTLEAAI